MRLLVSAPLLWPVFALSSSHLVLVGAQLATHLPLGAAIIVLSAGLTLLVVALMAAKLPLRLQRGVHAEAIRAEDGQDIVPRAV